MSFLFNRSAMTLLKCVLLSGLMVFAGCYGQPYHVYSGPKRPIEELAVLLPVSAQVTNIDGKNFHVPRKVYYLLPGEHSITARYFGTPYEGFPITLPTFFRKGEVYEVEGWIISGGKWRMQITHIGTVEEESSHITELEEEEVKNPFFPKKSLLEGWLWPF